MIVRSSLKIMKHHRTLSMIIRQVYGIIQFLLLLTMVSIRVTSGTQVIDHYVVTNTVKAPPFDIPHIVLGFGTTYGNVNCIG